jgi:hypothetical protein
MIHSNKLRANSMINIIENGINPILEKDKDNYPKVSC